MSYTIESGQGFVHITYKLHTCENEVHMIVYVVTDFSGNVWGVYTKDTKALARQEELAREYGQGYFITETEVNRNRTQEPSSTEE